MVRFNTSIHNYGSSSNTNLDPITYNSRYPWLDEENYRKLESKIDALGLTGYEKEQAMDKAYTQVLPIVQKDIQNSDRRRYLNEAQYEVSQIQDPSAKIQAQGKLNVEQLTQLVKEKWNLDPTANDQDVFNHWIQWIPNGWQLLANYINNWDRELLYAGGLETKMEAPEQEVWSVWGITSVINKESEIEDTSTLWKINKIADWGNLLGKATEWIDNWIQKIPVVTFKSQVENLANKINNLTEDEMQNLYSRYTNMVKNAKDTDIKDRGLAELMWDWLINGDQQAIDLLNTVQLNDYSKTLKQDWIERNQRGDQLEEYLLNKTGGDAEKVKEILNDKEQLNKIIDNDKNLSAAEKKLYKAWSRSRDKMKNLINFIGWSWWALENYAEAAWAELQQIDDIRNRRWTIPADMENNEEAFKLFVANKTANFGESLTDAPETLVGVNVWPNMAKFFTNIPWSFLKTLSSKVRAKTNPIDTKLWLLRMLFTEEWQQAMINRYWTIEDLQRTMEQDPVWFASDIIDWGDKINRAFNKWTWWYIERRNIWDVTDALSDNIVKWWTIRLWDNTYDMKWIQQGMDNVSNWLKDKWWDRTSELVNIERDAALNPTKVPEDVAREAWYLARDVYDLSESYKQKSADVWDKVKNAPTRTIPEKIVENDLKLTPTERANVEKNGITAANFVLKEGIANLDNADKIIALQDISSDAYNNVTNTFKDIIPETERSASKNAPKMLQIMIDTMEKSDIVKNEYQDYINKLEEMKNYDDYSPYEKLAIRRDFDAIVWNDIFNSKGRVTWLEDEIIAWYRAWLNDEINEIWEKYWLDVKEQNQRISNAITIRDWLIRSSSQWKKNNRIWLQDLWIWAILSSWDPVTAWGIFLGKKMLEKNSWKFAQTMYNLNSEPLKPANTKKWPWFIKKSNKNGSNRFMISSS